VATKVESIPLRIGARTYPGAECVENQERKCQFPSPLGEVYIITAGTGGREAGVLAAALTVNAFERFLQIAQLLNGPAVALRTAAQRINAKLYRKARSGLPGTEGMAASFVLALVAERRLTVCRAGACHAYLFRAGELQRLTRDRSPLSLIEESFLAEGETGPRSGAQVSACALGTQAELEPEIIGPIVLLPGDGVLLCSDGIGRCVNDQQMAQVISSHDDPQAVADSLIKLALVASDADGITVQYIRFNQQAARSAQPLMINCQPVGSATCQTSVNSPKRRRSTARVVLALGILLMVLMAGEALLEKAIKQVKEKVENCLCLSSEELFKW
jgi:PPM family protein phosphatase